MNKTKKIDVFARLFKPTKYCRNQNVRKAVPLANAAFTLIELIVVMAVIGVLVLLAAPKFIGYTREAKITQGTHDAKVIESSIDQHLFMHETIDEFLKNPSETDVLNTIAAQGALVSAKGIVDSVPDGDYYELSLSDIKNKLQVSMNSGNRVFVEKTGLVYVDIKSKGQVSSPDEPDVPDVPETDYYFEHTEEGVITNFYPSGKLSTLEKVTEVIIPDNIDGTEIVAIGDNAFSDKGISKISIPNTVKSIGVGAFQYNDLHEVVINEGTLILDDSFSFNGETKDSNTIENESGPGFYMLVDKKWIKATDPQWFIVNARYKEITGYHNSLVINGVTVQSPKDVVIPSSINGIPVESIGSFAFKNKSLTSVFIPKTVAKINSDNPFAMNPDIIFETSQLSEYFETSESGNGLYLKGASTIIAGNKHGEILDGTINIGAAAFNAMGITEINIPNSVTFIGMSAFSENALTSLTLPSTLNRIAHSAFSNNKITALDLPSTLTYIGFSAFYKNSISGTLIIPESVTTLENLAFSNNKIEDLRILGAIPVIYSHAFEENRTLTKLTLPEGLTTIEDYAFKGAKIDEVSFPSTLNMIGAEAFRNNNLTKLILPEGFSEIGENAFYGNDLTELYIPSSTTKIGKWAFLSNLLRKITIMANFERTDILFGGPERGSNFMYDNSQGIGTYVYNDGMGKWIKE